MKHLYFAVLGTLAMLTSFSQNWINGGNTLSANGTIGTNSSHSFLFETAGLERGRITNGGNWGIGSVGTTSRFTVNAVTGASPFRAQVNGGTKLIVGSNGGVSIGTANAGPANGLYVIGNIGVGTATPSYKLHVIGNAMFSSGITAASSGGYGVIGSGTYGVYGSGNYGVYGSGNSYGVYGFSNNYGIYGNSSYVGVYGTGTSYGLNGSGSYGVAGTGSYIGVFGTSTNGTAVVGNCTNGTGGNFFSNNGYGLVAGTGRTDKNWAGVFNGNVYAYGAYQTSDRTLKTNIEDFSDAMTVINQLKPKSYEFQKAGKLASLHLPPGKHYGLIAQELEEILPHLVDEYTHSLDQRIPAEAALADSPGNAGFNSPENKESPETLTIKAVNYIELIPVMIKGMQELHEENQTLREEIIKLQQIVGSIDDDANNLLGKAWIKQNSPNPVRSSTTIQYNIPIDSKSARILVTNAKGQQLKVYNVSGSGTVNFSAGTLPSGTYTYSLVLDGKTINTKKLVIVR
jgi:hypothetical protein